MRYFSQKPVQNYFCPEKKKRILKVLNVFNVIITYIVQISADVFTALLFFTDYFKIAQNKNNS